MIRIFIGWEPKETVAYHVLSHSILTRSSQPVCITPINKRFLPEFERTKEDGSTEFSFSRFLTPYLAGYTGQAIFMDCDMLVLCDIVELLELCDLSHDVFVVKHDYTPSTITKFFGQDNAPYPKKNWSSLMVFNCFSHACKRLTPEIVNIKAGSYLHRFSWCRPDRVGELPIEYNHLVGEYDPNPHAKIVHFTLGTPCINGYEQSEYAGAWRSEFFDMTRCEDPAFDVSLIATGQSCQQ